LAAVNLTYCEPRSSKATGPEGRSSPREERGERARRGGARALKIDVLIVGGGAAGLATAIFAARRRPDRKILVLDSARKLGAKILVSGGGRCNVTNRVVTEADFRGGSPRFVRRVLRAFRVEQTIQFFAELGVALHEEENGKLFPDSNRARTVLDALLDEAGRRGVEVLAGHRVVSLARRDMGFIVTTAGETLGAERVVLATGGLSLPKTGSDGLGLQIASRLGHSLVATTPALVPLVLQGDFHRAISGVSQPALLKVSAEGKPPSRVEGSLLWTHFGASGPAVLDASRYWCRARLEGCDPKVSANLVPGSDFEKTEKRLLSLAAERPRLKVQNVLGSLIPASVGRAVLAHLGISEETPVGQLGRDDRRRLVHSLFEWPLRVADSRGYSFAEATAGGVPLEEVDPRTMASLKCPELYLVGEMLDVDGRLGGFNFQWAWSTGFVAGASVVASRVG
jgi:predicted Rossmann fold flavoprotein